MRLHFFKSAVIANSEMDYSYILKLPKNRKIILRYFIRA